MRINVRGVHLFFDTDGACLVPDGASMRAKPTIILLHGGPGYDHSGFKPLFAQLSDLAQVVYLDMRGCGRSDRSSAAHWNLAEWSADLGAFCRALEIDKPIVYGLSFGGYVALTYAAQFPDNVSKLILASTTAKLRIDRALRVFERLGGPSVRAVAKQFWQKPSSESFAEYARVCLPVYNLQAPPPGAFQRAIVNQELTIHYFTPGQEGRSFDLREAAETIRCPTLIMAGTDDPITTIDDARDLAARVRPDLLEFAIFEGCRHGLHRDAPEKSFELLRQFISK